jgi:hypothetical protein|tara:strand:- start:263 stop:460 length:198 start_codon:yes stop_codon:yes gene_type:complete
MPTYKVRVYEAYEKTFVEEAKTKEEARNLIEEKGAMFIDDKTKRPINAVKSKIEEFRIDEIEEVL